jgi:hypothetical protein
MYRQGTIAPGTRFMRGGIIDDHEIHGTILKPQHEIFVEHRAKWLQPVEGAVQHHGMGTFGQ